MAVYTEPAYGGNLVIVIGAEAHDLIRGLSGYGRITDTQGYGYKWNPAPNGWWINGEYREWWIGGEYWFALASIILIVVGALLTILGAINKKIRIEVVGCCFIVCSLLFFTLGLEASLNSASLFGVDNNSIFQMLNAASGNFNGTHFGLFSSGVQQNFTWGSSLFKGTFYYNSNLAYGFFFNLVGSLMILLHLVIKNFFDRRAVR
jgi:hypothetical protein